MLKTKLQRDVVISIVNGQDLVGIYLESEPDNLLLECSPQKADELIALWNNKPLKIKSINLKGRL